MPVVTATRKQVLAFLLSRHKHAIRRTCGRAIRKLSESQGPGGGEAKGRGYSMKIFGATRGRPFSKRAFTCSAIVR